MHHFTALLDALRDEFFVAAFLIAVDDFDRSRTTTYTTQAMDSPNALFDQRRIPWQVIQHYAAAIVVKVDAFLSFPGCYENEGCAWQVKLTIVAHSVGFALVTPGNLTVIARHDR